MPESGRNFFQFVKGVPQEKDDLSYLPTYAHLIIHAAAYGCHLNDFDAAPKLLEVDPRPIPLDTFKSQQLMDYILVMGLFKDEDPKVVDDDSRLSEIVQGFASAGFQQMLKLHEDCGSDLNWLVAWEDVMFESSAAT